MHLRKTSIKRKGAVYTYAQIVESYRRDSDGLPATRVVCNLGQLSSLQYANFKQAIDASRTGAALVVKEGRTLANVTLTKPVQNLAFLDLAVAHAIWREYQLDVYFDDLFAKSNAQVQAGQILLALVLHRCVDADSKLSATRWFPSTALPELLGVNPISFNNTRIHRTLELVEQNLPSLMAKMPLIANTRGSAFASLFLDVTDVWFVGKGPNLAQLGKTKEGMLRKKIGVVLLCNEDGFPLRWEVVQGTANDCKTMTEMLSMVKNLAWIKATPLVCDRAMGKSAQVADMHAMGIHFITALTRTEFTSYAKDLPVIGVDDTSVKTAKKDLVKEVRQAARQSIMQEIDENLFVLDYGIVEKKLVLSSNPETFEDQDNYLGAALRLCRQIEHAVADGTYTSFQAAGAALGVKKGLVYRYRLLGRLPLSIQDRIIAGHAGAATIDDMIALSKLPSGEQIESKFSSLSKSQARRRPVAKPRQIGQDESSVEIELRVVAYFNPEIYVQKRLKAERTIARVKAFEKDLNSRLSNNRKQRPAEKILAEVQRYLLRDQLVEAFKVKIEETDIGGKKLCQVSLTLDEKSWTKRHRFDGMCVLVAHPEINKEASEIARLYRAKNMVEIDFRKIKSLIEIRPVRHQSDRKVKAHVAICMLSLLLERTLRKKLDPKMTAESALEILKTCHLNRYLYNLESFYSVTETDQQQQNLLDRLGLTNLADDDVLRERITARA